MNALALTLLLMTWRGDFIPQAELPYLDALPLDYPKRDKIISHYVNRAQKECSQQHHEEFWTYRAGTRLFLRDIKDPQEAGYILGQLQGRHFLWQWCPDGTGGCCWLDQWWLSQPELLPEPK